MYVFDFTTTDKDFINLSMFHYFQSPGNRKNRNVMKYTTPIIFGAFAFFNLKYYYFSLSLIVGIICLLSAVLWLIFFKQYVLRNIKKALKNAKAAGKVDLIGHFHMEFGDEFIFEASEYSEAKVKYSIIENIALADDAIYIFTGANKVILLPLSEFESRESAYEFKDF